MPRTFLHVKTEVDLGECMSRSRITTFLSEKAITPGQVDRHKVFPSPDIVDNGDYHLGTRVVLNEL